ncbi:MAG: alanine--tRNA ligase, partial [Bacteroidetes bacterium]|nr:alanine--tRNA ligase [Bacteroidota bacterium]
NLKYHEPLLHELVPVLANEMKDVFPELEAQLEMISKVVMEEETAFLRTLEKGLKKISQFEEARVKGSKKKELDGKQAFELYDTFGFPLDLTRLIAKEKGFKIDEKGFAQEMKKQKDRSRNAAVVEKEDWIQLLEDDVEEFIGYDYIETTLLITRYRKVKTKGKEFFHIVFNYTPFYAESGGQVGDTGIIQNGKEQIKILDTQKENDVIIHITEKLPKDLSADLLVKVDARRRELIVSNHSATHLLHLALRSILGDQVQQKGSYLDEDHLRFDFAHYEKVTPDELTKIEEFVNERIRKDIPLEEKRAIPKSEAKSLGAVALFGEKYGDLVRVIKYGDSVELCGGTHAKGTGQIGIFKITSESNVAAGVRRIEAVTSAKADELVNNKLKELEEISTLLNNPRDLKGKIIENLEKVIELAKLKEQLNKNASKDIKADLADSVEKQNGANLIIQKISIDSAASIKDLSFQLKNEIENLFLVIGAEINGKASLTVMIDEKLVKEKKLDAGSIVKELAKEIKGGGGGQAHYATAGGEDAQGLEAALEKAREIARKI